MSSNSSCKGMKKLDKQSTMKLNLENIAEEVKEVMEVIDEEEIEAQRKEEIGEKIQSVLGIKDPKYLLEDSMSLEEYIVLKSIFDQNLSKLQGTD